MWLKSWNVASFRVVLPFSGLEDLCTGTLRWYKVNIHKQNLISCRQSLGCVEIHALRTCQKAYLSLTHLVKGVRMEEDRILTRTITRQRWLTGQGFSWRMYNSARFSRMVPSKWSDSRLAISVLILVSQRVMTRNWHRCDQPCGFDIIRFATMRRNVTCPLQLCCWNLWLSDCSVNNPSLLWK